MQSIQTKQDEKRVLKINRTHLVLSSLYIFLVISFTQHYVRNVIYWYSGPIEEYPTYESTFMDKYMMTVNLILLFGYFSIKMLVNENIVIDQELTPNYERNPKLLSNSRIIQILASISLSIHFTLFYHIFYRQEKDDILFGAKPNIILYTAKIDFSMIAVALIIEILLFQYVKQVEAIKSTDKILIFSIILAFFTFVSDVTTFFFMGNFIVLSILNFHIYSLFLEFRRSNDRKPLLSISEQIQTISFGTVLLLGYVSTELFRSIHTFYYQIIDYNFGISPALHLEYFNKFQIIYIVLLCVLALLTHLISRGWDFNQTKSKFKAIAYYMISFRILVTLNDDYYYDVQYFGEDHGVLFLQDFLLIQVPAVISGIIGLNLIYQIYKRDKSITE